MVTTAPGAGYAALLGDVVGSRGADPGLYERLREAFERVDAALPGLQPLQVTVGDEFQGLYPRLADALNASLLLRLVLHGVTEVRVGVGWGSLTRWNPERVPYEQDGPAWWAARDALEEVDGRDRAPGTSAGWRTAVRFADATGDRPAEAPPSGAEPAAAPIEGLAAPRHLDVEVAAAVEGLVLLRDQVLSGCDERDVGLVLALLDGASVTEAAGRVGISQQAASRRLRSNGGYALVRSWHVLEGENA